MTRQELKKNYDIGIVVLPPTKKGGFFKSKLSFFGKLKNVIFKKGYSYEQVLKNTIEQVEYNLEENNSNSESLSELEFYCS